MKILFYQGSDVIDSSGGTEKVLCFLSSALAEEGYDVIFMTNEKKSGRVFFKLSDKVKFINVGGTKFSGIRKTIFKLIKSTPLIKIIDYFNNYKYTSDIVHIAIKKENPDLIILANPSDLLEISYSNSYKVPIIQMIHGVPWNIFYRKSKKILKMTLALMDKVKVCQVLMPSFVDLMKPYYKGRVVVIPNSVPTISDDFRCDYNNDKEKCVIINIARINYVKNQELVIKSFAKIADKYKKWEINFWGGDDKKYREKLELLIRENNLEDRVIFKGKTKEPMKELKNADIFVFPSLFEGFGLALTEAMAVGLPCIGLKTATAVSEIIINNKNGLLTENNVEDFTNKLETLMCNCELRKKLGKSAKQSMKNYNSEKIINMWKILIKEIENENN